MNLLEVIKNRRSIRKFEDKEIPKELIEELKEALIWAPSAGNLQSRKFYFLFNQKIKEKLTDLALGQKFIKEAPLVIIACADNKIEQKYGHRGKELYNIIDTSLSVQNILLMVHHQGLGGVVVAAFHEEKVSALLKIPSHLRPIMIIPVGYPASQPSAPPRISKEEAVKEVE